jgi:N6-L-threonylcarbamoyladenine synthase
MHLNLNLNLLLACLNFTMLFSMRGFNSKIPSIGLRVRSLSATKSAIPREGIGLPKGYANPNARYTLERTQGALSGLPNLKEPFIVLGIETSCDDTGVAVVSSDGNILANVVISQHEIHEAYGGIFPSLAMEAHKKNIDVAIERAVTEAGLESIGDVSAICFTKGPGLEICLRVGCRRAQELACEFDLPLVATHHLESHCLIARLAGQRIVATEDPDKPFEEQIIDGIDESKSEGGLQHFSPKIQYPYLALLASGGHTSLLLVRGMGDYSVIGATLDDALGESFDKCARLVGVRTGGAGGVAVEEMAKKGDSRRYAMKVPMQEKPNCDFSYAGLKNAFRITVKGAREAAGLDIESTNAPARQGEQAPAPIVLPNEVKADLCASFQHIAFEHVEDRLHRAMDYIDDEGLDIRSLVVVGGVAANSELRRRLLNLLSKRAEVLGKEPFDLVFPPLRLCTDNGVMPAWAGIEKLFMGLSDEVDNQDVIARWPLGLPILNKDGEKRVFKKRKLKRRHMNQDLGVR